MQADHVCKNKKKSKKSKKSTDELGEILKTYEEIEKGIFIQFHK